MTINIIQKLFCPKPTPLIFITPYVRKIWGNVNSREDDFKNASKKMKYSIHKNITFFENYLDAYEYLKIIYTNQDSSKKITAENFSIHNFTDLILPANSSTILDTVNLFAPNSSLEGYVNFQDASPDTVSANVFLYYQNEVDAVATSQTDTTGFFRFD